MKNECYGIDCAWCFEECDLFVKKEEEDMNYIVNMNDWCKAVCDNYSSDCLNRECADKYNEWLLNGAVQNELWKEVDNDNRN